MCECYKIGGPFIAEDPDCPIHGREAQERELNKEKELERIERLEERIERLEAIIAASHDFRLN